MITTKAYFEEIDFHIIQELMKAKESIKICVAWISWSKYSPIFDKLTSRGIKVEVMYNHDDINKKYFHQPNNKTILYAIKGRYLALMHNKFCIIDDSIILTGSFNWSRNARNHFENIVIIKNDFRLIKEFLTEYRDLISYFYNYSSQPKVKCAYEYDNYKQCGCNSYNLGVMGHESGRYDESLISIWNICLRHEHTTLLGEYHEQYLQTYLGLRDAPIYDDGTTYDKNTMHEEINQEFNQINEIYNHFLHRNPHQIHAVGYVSLLNENEHLEWGHEQEYGIKIFWRDMCYRKIIPETINDDYDWIINKIINTHQ